MSWQSELGFTSTSTHDTNTTALPPYRSRNEPAVTPRVEDETGATCPAHSVRSTLVHEDVSILVTSMILKRKLVTSPVLLVTLTSGRKAA